MEVTSKRLTDEPGVRDDQGRDDMSTTVPTSRQLDLGDVDMNDQGELRRLQLSLAATLLLVGSCSSTEPSPPSSDANTSAASPSTTAPGSDTCDLLSDAEAERLLGDKGVANPGQTGGTPNCQWITSEGRYVQVIQTSSSVWAEGLPAALKALEASGLANDPENVRKLREDSRLIESGKKLNAAQACSMFTRMVEIQGRPPGSNDVATVFPTRENPLGVTSQICSDGIFTSVLLANKARPDGQIAPLKQPIQLRDEVVKTARRIHTAGRA